jgi:hypothetical protein
MKAFGKELVPLHLDPIMRDLVVVLAAALAIAALLVSVGFILFH